MGLMLSMPMQFAFDPVIFMISVGTNADRIHCFGRFAQCNESLRVFQQTRSVS